MDVVVRCMSYTELIRVLIRILRFVGHIDNMIRPHFMICDLKSGHLIVSQEEGKEGREGGRKGGEEGRKERGKRGEEEEEEKEFSTHPDS